MLITTKLKDLKTKISIFIEKYEPDYYYPEDFDIGTSKNSFDDMMANLEVYKSPAYLNLWRLRHPVSYYYHKKVALAASSLYDKVEDAIYFVECHVFDKAKYHKLDLRQPKDKDSCWGYQHGWIDADTQLLFACFNILRTFVEVEMDENLDPIPIDEDNFDNESVKERNKFLQEVKELYDWWLVDREVDYKKWIIDCEMNSFENQEAFFEKETEMLIRLMKIRGGMWT